ncbi:MAG: hypothetical protein ACHQ9S_23905 [Candidatus Binatia bacterium]
MSEPIVLGIHNPHRHDTLFRVLTHWGGLPDGVELVVGLAGVPARESPTDAGALKLLPTEIDAGCGRKVKVEPSHVYRLSPDKHRRSELPEILIAAGKSAFAVIHIGTIKKLPPGPRPQFDIVQMEGKRVVGGYTVQIRGPL